MEILVLLIAFGASVVGAICGIGGIAGGMAGRKVNKKLNTTMVDKLFIGLITVIIGISCYNAWRFLSFGNV